MTYLAMLTNNQKMNYEELEWLNYFYSLYIGYMGLWLKAGDNPKFKK